MVDRVSVIDLPSGEWGDEVRASHVSAFVAGPENRLAVAALQRVLQGDLCLDEAPWLNPLVVTGPSGVGKSHLARGITRYWTQLVGGEAVAYFTAIDFARQLHAARSDRQLEFFRALLTSLRLLVVEDLQNLPQRTFVQRELRETIDTLLDAGSLVVITTQDLVQLQAGLRDRLLGGLTIRLCPLGPEARRELLRQASAARGMLLSEDQLRQLADRIDASALQLQRALVELDCEATEGVNLSEARERPVHLKQIVAVVARYYSLTQAALLSPARRKSLVHARGIVVYLARLLTDMSYSRIGQGLGRRDHSTIMHAHQSTLRLAATDPATQRDLDELRRILTAV